MGQPEPPGVFDLGVLRTPRGLLLAGELVLSGGVVALLAPPAPPTLAPALLQTLAGAAALGGLLLRDPPQLPPGYGTCLDLLRAVSGTLIFLVVALVALASSRDALAATTFIPTRSAADGHRPPPLSPCPPVSPPHFGGPAPQIKPRPTPGAAQGRVGGVGWARGHRVPLVAH
ncbi:uncharacterized protein LOC125316914 isoform X2 [Corvus hawaiiensis]|uniref:uncharacterized protein LOC125316914 isoform X2 n=1 Tax=Corvus hawaiiensis TaxID=134902 RepID=UPI0020189127|nr:uncharacterized protein LOC125316914 isoform X2 [Corvus hawaiiensis]